MVRADWLTATERAILHTERAWALAKLGRVQDTVSAVGLADEEFSHMRPANDPAYVRYYNAEWHASCTGSALCDIAVDGYFIAEARQRLSDAVTGLGEEFARGRAMSRIRLASLVMVTGDPGEAAAIGNQALDAVSDIRSRRAADKMRDLRRFAEPHARLTAVAELTHRIGSLVVV